jgi:hypothetical protein
MSYRKSGVTITTVLYILQIIILLSGLWVVIQL